MRGVIITGGQKPAYSNVQDYFANADIVIAADSGYDWAREHSVAVDILVGDMDSTQIMSIPDNITVHRYPREKDYTDTEIALHTARSKGADSIAIIGGGGGRLDHLIALLWIFHRDNPPDIWATDTQTVFCVSQRLHLQVQKDTTISVFPVGTEIVEVHSTGLYWPLDTHQWHLGDSGVSNIATASRVDLQILSGRVIVVVGYEGLR